MLDKALLQAQRWLLERFDHFFDRPDVQPALYVLAAMVLEDLHCLNPDEMLEMFAKHAPGDNWTKAQAQACLEPLLDTLILESHDPDYCLGGPPAMPYFPTLVRSVWGSERFYDIILHRMDA